MFSFFKSKPKKPKALEVTDQSYNDLVVNSTQPILLDFWAPWCGPCKVLGPIIDELAQEYEGRAVIGKVNVDENPRLAQLYKVKSIPSIAVIHNQKLAQQSKGMIPKPNLEEIIDHYIALSEKQQLAENTPKEENQEVEDKG